MVTDFVVVLSRWCKIIRVVFNEHSEDGDEALGAKLIVKTKCITTMVCESKKHGGGYSCLPFLDAPASLDLKFQ